MAPLNADGCELQNGCAPDKNICGDVKLVKLIRVHHTAIVTQKNVHPARTRDNSYQNITDGQTSDERVGKTPKTLVHSESSKNQSVTH